MSTPSTTERANASPASWLASLSAEEREARIAALSDEDAAAVLHCWQFWARPDQLPPPGDWRVWLIQTGRGWGKTRTGAEWVRAQIESGRCRRIALVGPTAADVRDTMIEGPSGILACCPEPPQYEPSKRRVTWPNGGQAIAYSAEEPDRLRGPQHDGAYCDELAAWTRLQDTWDMLMFGLRMGQDPRVVITTTPRPLNILRQLAKQPTTHVTRGSTYDNLDNLAPQFRAEIVARYEGTRLGRQELMGELLEDVEGALWQRQCIDALRVQEAPELQRIVVAIDPAVTAGEDSDETGIIVGGLGWDNHAYIIADLSCRVSPDAWARRAVAAFDHHEADRVVAEVNNGGDLVEALLRTVRAGIPYTAVHASRGKAVRAEPVAALYEQGRVHHIGELPDLEDQLCNWVPGVSDGSPDRADALVWALWELIVSRESEPLIAAPRRAVNRR